MWRTRRRGTSLSAQYSENVRQCLPYDSCVLPSSAVAISRRAVPPPASLPTESLSHAKEEPAADLSLSP